ncbi:LuxR C-terminal-related transcriptional regulator [Alisedimentitalea sp. MJ-SS2]|uniref:LuxR C-terminal-related transcriptional regulator n=1 Tax=Aliisedimentitalea sp. MJ-SS2 TaxID=3049795 RepID=UPI0029150E60|nr:LuxR C-terminal-related transcriptional regulator [Alisedimentitalea sp. MJ-SS2]MDU8928901.1 LuxR C-terminal-related transcriptional regulator [Alisedimentitalea sp. MJ-SS2]
MNAKPHRISTDSGSPSRLAQDVIDRLYEVAVDPARYEELLDQWETLISPYRRTLGLDTPIALTAIDFESHFRRADQVLDSLTANADPNTTTPGILSRFQTSAAFTINRDLTLGEINPPAMQVFNLFTGAPLSSLPLEPDDLAALIEQVTRAFTANVDTPHLLRARLRETSRLAVFQLRVLRPEDAPPFIVAVSSELIWPDRFDDFLKSVFSLTEAETQVLRALSECHSLQDIADQRGRSLDTVRTQIKSILAKTETHSQAELIRLTLSTMDIATYTQDAAAQAQRPQTDHSSGFAALRPRPYHTLMLPDGRRFDYLILGDPAGRPVLFGPQDYGLTRWPASAEADAALRGVKVIVPVRAGYGNSTPLPRDADMTRSIILDYAHLLDHLGVSRCPIISLGGDFFFSAHFHDTYPDRVSALIACAGILPLNRAEQYQRMHKWHRFILAGARYTPHLLPFMVKAGFALARRLGKRKFVHAVYGDSPADVATFENPEVFEAMVVGSEVCLSDDHSAHAAFASEVTLQETTDWSGPVRRTRDRCPVHFLNGSQDPQTPPATLAELKGEYPWIDFINYEDSGQLVFFAKWPEVLDLVEKYI